MNKCFKWPVQISVITVTLGLAFQAPAKAPPFWKSKPEVYKRIKEDRAVIVSAKSEKNEDGEKTMVLTTAGRIRAPLYFTHKITTDYGRYQKILPYVDETSFDKETNNLFASGSFMGLKSKMTLKLSSTPETIEWEIVSGFLTGMKGVITEEKISDDVTEISMDANYSEKKGSKSISALPGFLLNWGFEFMGQKMATAMRSYVEEQWQKETESDH